MAHPRAASLRTSTVLLTGALMLSAVAGCGGSHTGTTASRVTTPTPPPLEPRNANGQQLEDLFFPYVAGMERFDLDAALDEGSGGYAYYDETAAGEYYDETAAGEAMDETARLELLVSELRDLHQRLSQLEQGLAAEAHPLSESIGQLREDVALVMESPEDYPDVAQLSDVGMLVAADFTDEVEQHVEHAEPRSRNATDCSLATIALYGALNDELIDVRADARMSVSDYTSEQDMFRAEQQTHLGATAAIMEWLDRHRTLPADPWEVLEELVELGGELYDIDTYLTPGTDAAVSAAFDQLAEAEGADEVRAALDNVRAAVAATLANVASAPFEAELRAYDEIPTLLLRAMDQLPAPGPRAALRVLRRRSLRAAYETIELTPDRLNAVTRWARVACEGGPAE